MRIIADDLTGAADAGVCFVRRGAPVRLLLYPSQRTWLSGDPSVVSVDTATRDADRRTATARLWTLVRGVAPGLPLLKKVDSTLRGHLAAEMEVLATLRTESTVILAPAFPRTGRTTRGGVQHVHGMPIGAASSVRGVLGAVRSTEIGIETVRTGGPRLTEALHAARSFAAVVVCDAETDRDLDTVVKAGERLDGEVVWAGSGGLAGALARAGAPAVGWRESSESRWAIARLARDVRFVAVVGSMAPVARRQAQALAGELEADLMSLSTDTLSNADPTVLEGLRTEVTDRARRRSLVVVVSGGRRREPAVDQALGFATGAAAAEAPVVVLTGGATARAVLDAVGVDSLALLEEIEPGVVLSATARGQHVVTKAGAFGDDRSLLRALKHTCGQS